MMPEPASIPVRVRALALVGGEIDLGVGSSGLAEGRRILQSAIGVVRVEAARQADIRFCADIALENLGVVALCLDGAFGPILVETEHFAKSAFGTEQAGRGGALLCRHGVSIGSGDPMLFTGD